MYGTVRSANRTAPKLVRYGSRCGTDRGAFAVLNNKRITVPILVRYGSRSNTKKRTVTIKGSVRFTLQTVRIKNDTVTVALAAKNGTAKKTENGKDKVRTRYGTDTMTNSDPLLYINKHKHRKTSLLIAPFSSTYKLFFLKLIVPFF